MRKLGYVVAAVAMILAATVTNALAAPITVPEINPGSVAAGLGLLTGGVLLVRARLRR